jgi:hypothetical protein
MKESRWVVGFGALLALLLGAVGDGNYLSSSTISAKASRGNTLEPGPAAATSCPPYSFVNNTNLAKNPSFEVPGPNGPSTTWQMGGPDMPPSAANNWFMHSSNQRATVSSNLVPTNVPGTGGSKMIHFIAGGNEGGIYQRLESSPAKLMFSAWVFVRRGHVVLQPNGGNQGPSSWSTKLGEWEQLRVCNDGTLPTGYFAIWNEDPAGGEFFIDRIEIRETP